MIRLAQLASTARLVRLALMTRDPARRAVARYLAEAESRRWSKLAETLSGSRTIGRRMTSIKASTCAACCGAIVVGDEIAWMKKTAVCSRCLEGGE